MRPVLAVGGAVFLVMAAALIGALILGPAEGEAVQPAPPHVEEVAWRNEQLARLHSYGWIDREQGIAHIPVERAMELVVEESR